MADKKQTAIRLTLASDAWLADTARRQGISKNAALQLLVNKAMDEEKRARGA